MVRGGRALKGFNLCPYTDASFVIETLTDKKPIKAGLVKIEVESLYTSEVYALDNVVSNISWTDDKNSLPHKLDLSGLDHFSDVKIIELQNCETVGVLIGNDNACLMTVLEERVGRQISDPHATLTPLGWMAYGGMSPLDGSDVKIRRVQALATDVEI